ncbi:hypothetical protein A9Q84_01855 [Halobacteriovorax marinus]|uniref:Lipoprotein n=1 Tax=Halobacteriovorax marinus TaxID=97084 RepID=A0A1Y5FIW4_9BACT|nr:hypothetical protein A9Q84_01855 [Halobacteriovorax marinus]
MKNLILLGSILLSGAGFAAEADHYTSRNDLLEDISDRLNSDANESLRKAVENSKALGECDSKKAELALYKELRNYFANHTKGEIVKGLLHSNNTAKRAIPLNESIYGEWSIFDGYLLGKKSAANSPLALSPMIKVGEQLVGIDKLEHMFGMGFKYFKSHHIKGKKLRKVLKRGIFSEKTILGGNILATGVFAYGDLSANFNGMRFWNHVLQRRDDVLGADQNIGPYILCVDNSFVVNTENPIDFKNYIDASMDESVNCSKFATKNGARKYKRAMEKRGFSCPMSQSSLNEILTKYGVVTPKDRKKRPISHWIINTDGNEDVSYFNEF